MATPASTLGPDLPAGRPRVEWIDHAKGICIFFVVMLHVNDVAQEWTGELGWLEHVVTFARPFRMPDFFLIAGLFLASAMKRPWRRYLDGKVVHFLYLYGLWMTLQFGLFDLRHLIAGGAGALEIAGRYLLRWIEPSGALWFIHILPVFFVVTRLLRPVPPWLVWLAAAALHNLQIESEWHVIREGASRYVFFYSGYVLAPYIFRIAASAYEREVAALGYLACWGVGNALVVEAGVSQRPFVSLGLGYAGGLAVIVFAVMLSKLSWARPLQYCGQHSLVVYLADWAVSLVVVRTLALVIGDIGTLGLVSTVVTMAGTIALWRVARRTPGRFMYERPRWLSLERVGATPPRAGEP